MPEYEDSIPRLAETHSVLAAELASIRTLEKLLPWLGAKGVDLAKLDLIPQDEFCYDMLVPLDREWLAFGMG